MTTFASREPSAYANRGLDFGMEPKLRAPSVVYTNNADLWQNLPYPTLACTAPHSMLWFGTSKAAKTPGLFFGIN